MSNLQRLKRLTKSWIGSLRKRRRSASYEQDDPRMIINELGLQMSPETLTFLADSSYHREDLLVQIHGAEEELDIDLIRNNVEIDPIWDPKVYEDDSLILFTVVVDEEEVIIVEFDRKAN